MLAKLPDELQAEIDSVFNDREQCTHELVEIAENVALVYNTLRAALPDTSHLTESVILSATMTILSKMVN